MIFEGRRRFVLSTNAVANIARMLMGADPFRPRRRRRTKFSAEQKARMEAFAARIGWKVRKQDLGEEDEVSRFCREIGITRHVFKNWIHNHKGRAAAATSASNTAGAPADAEGEGGGEREGEVGGSTSLFLVIKRGREERAVCTRMHCIWSMSKFSPKTLRRTHKKCHLWRRRETSCNPEPPKNQSNKLLVPRQHVQSFLQCRTPPRRSPPSGEKESASNPRSQDI